MNARMRSAGDSDRACNVATRETGRVKTVKRKELGRRIRVKSTRPIREDRTEEEVPGGDAIVVPAVGGGQAPADAHAVKEDHRGDDEKEGPSHADEPAQPRNRTAKDRKPGFHRITSPGMRRSAGVGGSVPRPNENDR